MTANKSGRVAYFGLILVTPKFRDDSLPLLLAVISKFTGSPKFRGGALMIVQLNEKKIVFARMLQIA